MSNEKLTLMQHHDAELTALQSRVVKQRSDQDPEARVYLDQLRTIGDGVRDAAGRTSASANLTDAIMARVELEQHPGVQRPRPTRRLASTLGFGFGSVVAVAAAVLVWLSVPTEPQLRPHSGGAKRAAAVVPPGIAAHASVGVEIESVDFGAGGGSIFLLEKGHETTPVVWLSEAMPAEARSGQL